MKEILTKPLILILFINLWLQGCDKSDNELNPSVEVQDFVWKGLNAYYLYQEDIDDLSDRRFSSNQQLEGYLSGFDTPGAIFNSLSDLSQPCNQRFINKINMRGFVKISFITCITITT